MILCNGLIILTAAAIFAAKLSISSAVYLLDDSDDHDKIFTRRRIIDDDDNNYSSSASSSSSDSLLVQQLRNNKRIENDILVAVYSNNSDSFRPIRINDLLDNPSTLDAELQNYSSNVVKATKRRRNVKLSLCENCDCRRDTNSFITVVCDLYQKGSQHSFGSNNEIPSTATSLIVKLGPDASLKVDEGLFDRSKINRVYFECKKGTNGQIEIRPDAFKGNLAPFPDIEIVNCHTVALRSNAFTGEFKLNITNCHDVIIYSDAFYNTAFPGYFHNIADLRIHEQAFNKAKAKLDITNSKIDDLYRFEASLREIRFYNCTIGSINPGTFDVIAINSIIFEYCKIDFIKTRAITEKLFSSHLAFTGAIIGIIENEAINGSGITELILTRNEIDTIQEKAIYVTAVSATISHNRIKHLGNEWLRVKDWSNITVSKNQFGDFGAMTIEKAEGGKSCLFEGNFITNPQPGCLNLTDRRCIIRETSFYHKCICKFDWLEKLSSRDLRSEAYCQVDDSLKFCFNTTIFNVLKYQHEVCDYTKTKLDCIKNISLKKIEGSFVQPEELEKSQWERQRKLVYILIGIGILLVISGCLFIIAQKVIGRRPSAISITENAAPQTGQHGNLGSGNSGSGVGSGTTLKELKIFSNDDRRIINQTLEIMKQKYSPEIFELVYRNTQTLLQGNITEIQRVKTIGEIVQTLGDCENAGEDFVAFTDILYKHLAPTGSSNTTGSGGGSGSGGGGGGSIPPDPVYAEPTLPNLNTIDDQNGNIDGQTNIDHIYAEPHSVQQPLLTNEYASPADRDELFDLYSEPISNEKDRIIIPPYAVTNPKNPSLSSSSSSSATAVTSPPVPSLSIMRQHHHNHNQHQPSTSKNLPDVLNASKPLTNVQKLAQNFANDPTFHITRSPNTNRRIPKYTIPNIKTKQHEKPSENQYYHHPFTPPQPSGSSNSSSSATAVDSRSNHSGGSDVTVQIDDIIEYADA